MSDATPAAALFDTAAVPPVAEANTPVPGAEGQSPQSATGNAPVSPGAPASSPSPAEQAPVPDPAELERLRQVEADFQRQRQQWDQIRSQQEEQLRQHQQAQMDAQRQQQAQQYLDQAWHYAQRLDTEEERQAYIRQASLNVANAEREYQQQLFQQQIAQQQQQQEAMQLSGFPDYIGKQWGLNPAQVDALRDLPDAKSMIASARQAQIFNEQTAELRRMIDQQYANQQANAAAASGALAMGGNPTGSGGRIKPGASDEELDAAAMRFLGLAS